MDDSLLVEFLLSLPKTETHLHLEGALPWEFLKQVDVERFSKEPEFRKKDFRYQSFEEFESILIEHAMLVFNSADSYYEVSKFIFEKHLAQNVKYVELSFHAGMIEFIKVPGDEILSAILAAVPDELEVRVFLGISRNAYTPFLAPRLEDAIENWDELSGIDLHGLESLPMEAWTEPFWKKAGKSGKELKAHAGEFGPAENVAHAIEKLGVRRIQHGIRASEDEEVLNRILDTGTTLDVCPISNYKLRVIKNWTEHPLKNFLDRGISCTVSTDDPFSFGNNLVQEYQTCIEKLSISPPEIAELAKNGFEVASIEESRKKYFQKKIDTLTKEFMRHYE